MVRRIAWNTFFLSISHLVARTIGFFYFLFLARVLGVTSFGVYAFTVGFVYNFIPLADFGIDRLVLREVSRKPAEQNSYYQRLVPLRLITSFLALLSAVILGFLLHQPSWQIAFFAVFGLGLVPNSQINLITAITNAKEKMSVMALANISLIVLTAILGGLFYYLGLPLLVILAAYPFANTVLFLAMLMLLPRWGIRPGFIIDGSFWRWILSRSWVFGAIMVMAVFYLRASLMTVGLLLNPQEVGWYGAVFKFIDAGILIPQSLALALFPLSARLYSQDKTKLKSVYLKSWLILLLTGLVAGGMVYFLAGLVVRLAYGDNYLSAFPAFRVLGLALILFFVNALPGNIIQNSEKVRLFLPFAALNLAVVVVFCLLLVPRYGIIGAAWAVVAGELVGLIINNLFVLRLLRNA